MNRVIICLLLAALPAAAQLSISSVSDNGVETTIGTVFGLGQAAAGDSKEVRFRLKNTGTPTIDVLRLCVIPSANTAAQPCVTPPALKLVHSPSPPFAVGGNLLQDFAIAFSPPDTATYEALLLVESQSRAAGAKLTAQTVRLFGTGVRAPVLSVAAPCTLPAATSIINFGSVEIDARVSCVFTLRNPYSDELAVAPFRPNPPGIGFSGDETFAALVKADGVTLAAQQSLNFTITLTGSASSVNFSGTLTVATRTFSLTGTRSASSTPTLSISAVAPCAGPASGNAIIFPATQQGAQISCSLMLANSTNTPANILIQVTSTNQGIFVSAISSLNIAANGSAQLSVTFKPTGPGTFSATIIIGTQTYALRGIGLLPAAIFSLDSNSPVNNQQYRLSLRLASPSAISASGTLKMTFTPTASGAPSRGITDDGVVQFTAIGTRQVTCKMVVNSDVIQIDGRPDIVIATGTTAGRIVLSLTFESLEFASPATHTITLSAAPVSLSTATATRRGNELDVVLKGFDNTYTIGPMGFTFYNRAGSAIGSPISADFTSAFRGLYQDQNVGSTFRMQATFPVTGDAAQVGGVEVKLSNSAGATNTQRLAFP